MAGFAGNTRGGDAGETGGGKLEVIGPSVDGGEGGRKSEISRSRRQRGHGEGPQKKRGERGRE